MKNNPGQNVLKDQCTWIVLVFVHFIQFLYKHQLGIIYFGQRHIQ